MPEVEEQAHDATAYTKTYNLTPEETKAVELAQQQSSRTSFGRSFIEACRQFATRVGLADPLAPTITGLSPSTKVINTAAFVLTVNGTKFLSGSEVQWNGVVIPTTYVSSTQVTAQVPANVLTPAGTVPITVRNGSAVSPSSNFTLTATTLLEADPQSEDEPDEQEQPVPDMAWLKADIVTWLVDWGVDIDEPALENLTKTELLSLVEDVQSPPNE